jgi:hypothetical protein
MPRLEQVITMVWNRQRCSDEGWWTNKQEEFTAELFYWKEIERRARAAQALAMLHNGTDMDGISQANAILDELCLDRKGAERLIRSRMARRPAGLDKASRKDTTTRDHENKDAKPRNEKRTFEGTAMDADQDFNTFLREWTKERIGPTDEPLGSRHLQELRAELRAIELIQLAKEKGFRDNLTETQKAYGSVLAYVKHLMREADQEAASSHDHK